MKLLEIITQTVADLMHAPKDQIQIDHPPQIEFGEIAIQCFPFSKFKKQPPATIAQQLAQSCATNPQISKIAAKVTAVGPYLNFSLTDMALLESAKEALATEHWQGLLPAAKTMVEFLSPNTNKPLHLGHLRNAFLGDAVSRLLTACGQTVIKANLINDRGVHICKSMLAWQQWANSQTPQSTGIKGDHFVGNWYVKYAQEVVKNPQLEQAIREMLKKWETGDAEIKTLWTTMNDWVMAGFDETLKRLGIEFDRIYFESNTYKLGKDIVETGVKKGIFTALDDGSIIYPLPEKEFGLSKEGSHKFVQLIRADGTSVYITQDIGTAILKADNYDLDRSIYVVGSEQNYHFQCLFAILKALGYPWSDGLYHLSYGMVKLPSGKMKSREGTVVDADDLINDMIDRVKSIVTEKHPELPKHEVNARSIIIAIGAMKFYFLINQPNNGMNYDPAASISFDGKTGPYCQYAAVRAGTILEKAAEKGLHPDMSNSTDAFGYTEKALLVQLIKLPRQIKLSAENLNPSILAEAVYAIAQAFNSFYNSTPIIKDGYHEMDKGLIGKRLLLVEITHWAIKAGLNLLGIQTPDKM